MMLMLTAFVSFNFALMFFDTYDFVLMLLSGDFILMLLSGDFILMLLPG